MKLSQVTYDRVERYLKSKNSIIIPIGSTEQHSPVGLLGTDYFIAEEIANKVGEHTKTLVTPTLSFGMSNHHLGFCGTISLNPTTLIAVVKDVILSLFDHGFRKFYFVNGHGGNVSPVQSAFSELTRDISISCKIVSWWMMPEIKSLTNKLFGEKEGEHATPSEISITIFLYENCFNESIPSFNVEKSEFNWPLSPKDFKKTFPDGRMHSDPSLANHKLGKMIYDKAIEIIQKDFTHFESN